MRGSEGSAFRARVLALAVVSAMLPTLASASEGSETFRTVVIFGDTQDLVDERRIGSSPAGFRTMVDWVLEHREEQRIDFVLHVGDAISHGGALPLGAACLDEAGRCDRRRRHARGQREIACSCALLRTVEREWARFNAEWRRFDGVIPYAIVRGNHDNLGVAEPNGQLDRPGFAAFYGPARFESAPGSGFVGGHADEKGISQAWTFPLGERRVLVIGAAHRFSPQAVQWAKGVLDAHPDLPAIALAHQYFQGVPHDEDRPRAFWKKLVAPHAGRFRLAVWGHVSPGEVRFVGSAGSRLLRIRTNWQGRRGARTFLHLVRFHEGGVRGSEVEVLAFDPVRGRHDFERGLERSPASRGRLWLPRQPFGFGAEAKPPEPTP